MDQRLCCYISRYRDERKVLSLQNELRRQQKVGRESLFLQHKQRIRIYFR